MQRPKRRFRILLVEDDDARARRIRGMLPEDVICVRTCSAGRAVGLLRRDRGRVYGGILLDHDLGDKAATATDLSMSGAHVARAIIENIDPSVPILVHSMNPAGAAVMISDLKGAGFEITRIPMSGLNHQDLAEWLEDAMDFWEE